MKNKILRTILNIRRKFLFMPFEKTLIKLYHKLQDDTQRINANIKGINYLLDLTEIVDNKVFYGNWEYDTTKIFKEKIKKGMTILDVGANMGYFTLLGAKLTGSKGKVYAFEPTSGGIKRLKKNVSLNNFNNIKIENIGLSDENKKIEAKIRHSWKRKELKESKREVVLLKRLDDYVKQNKVEKIDFVKIDVDGYEYKVLKGAIEVLKKDKPIICMEIGNSKVHHNLEDYGIDKGYSLQEIISLMEEIGYVFFNEKGVKETFDNMYKEIILEEKCQNYLLLNKLNEDDA